MAGTDTPSPARRPSGWIPGEIGLWNVVFGDLMVFGLLFCCFAYYRHLDPALFAAGRDMMNRGLGVTNTLLLLTSSALVALAVQRVRAGRSASRLMGAAAVLGLGFVVIKSIEWKQKFTLGLTIETNDYFMYYFMAGGIHLLHVLVGTGFLFYGAIVLRSQDGSANPKTIEAIGIFWHLVDLLWVFLFALFYLV